MSTAAVVGLVLAVAGAAAFIVAAYVRRWEWAGFTASEKTGQDSKTLWDWLQLLVIPLGLAAVAFALNAAQSSREQRREDRRAAVERLIAADQRRDDALRLYLQQMSNLILGRGLLSSEARSESRAIARTVTLGVLSRLDRRRKGIVLQFLVEAHLIGSREQKISMQGADLRGMTVSGGLDSVNFRYADLRGADFSGSTLKSVSFRQALLQGSDFSSAKTAGLDFYNADLSGANFSQAVVRKANFMDACLTETRFARTQLIDDSFPYAQGHDIDFSGARLLRVDLGHDSTLENVKFVHAYLEKTPLPRWHKSRASHYCRRAP